MYIGKILSDWCHRRRNSKLYKELGLSLAYYEFSSLEQARLRKSPKIISIDSNYEHSFSLEFDFADAFVFDIKSEDVIDIIGQILDIRLAYDSYKPVYIRLSDSLPKVELQQILDYSQLNGVDGFVVENLELLRSVSEYTKKRFPVIVKTSVLNVSEELEELKSAGASLIELYFPKSFLCESDTAIYSIKQ